jgi:hypothetical protein
MSLRLLLNAADTINVALHRPATQSSVSQWSQPNESSRAVNGQRTGSFAFHTLAENSPWWKVDLEREFPLDAIVIWNREGEFADRARTIQIHVSIDDTEWLLVHTGLIHFGGVRDERPLIHLLGGKVRARYVRISLEEPTPLHLDEVEVLVSKNFFAAEKFWRRLELYDFQAPVPQMQRDAYRVIVPKGSVSSPSLEITALNILRYNRFGNNFHQMLNAAALASELNIRQILLPTGMVLGASMLGEFGGIRFLNEGDPISGRALSGQFYFCDQFSSLFSKVSVESLYQTLTHTIQPLYNNFLSRALTPASGAMHFHFRSGDIFGAGQPHGAYVQPPLSFYKTALAHAVEHLGVERAVIVYEDTNNPCVAAFTEYLKANAFPFSAFSGSIEDDICELLQAEIICYGFGTFVESILCLSWHIRAAYAFRDVDCGAGINKPRGLGIREILLRKGLALHVVNDIANGYIERNGWKNSAAQREIMLTYPDDALLTARI